MLLRNCEELELDILKIIVEESNTIVIWWNGSGESFYYGDQFLEYSLSDENIPEVFEKGNVGEYLYFEDLTTFRQMLERAKNGKAGCDVLVRLKRKSGTCQWCQLQLTLFKQAKGQELRGVCMLISRNELSDIKLHQKEINEQGRDLLSIMPCGVVILRAGDFPEWNILFVSDGTESLYGYSKAERDRLTGRKVKDLFWNEDWKECLPNMMEGIVNNNGFSGTMRVKDHNGNYIWTAIRARRVGRVKDDLLVCVVLIGAEEEKSKEIKLLEKNDTLSTAVRDADVTVWKENLETNSIEEETVVGNSWKKKGFTTNLPNSLVENKVVSPRSKVDFLVLYRRLWAGEKKIKGEVWFTGPNQAEWCERITYEVFYDADEEPLYAMGMAQDITQEKVMEAQLQREIVFRDTIKNTMFGSAVMNLTKNHLISMDAKTEYLRQKYEVESADAFLAQARESTRVIKNSGKLDLLFNREWLLSQYEMGIYTEKQKRESYVEEGKLLWNEVTISMTEDHVSGDVFAIYFTEDISAELTIRTISEMVPQLVYEALDIVDLSHNLVTKYTLVEGEEQIRQVNDVFNRDYERYIRENCSEKDLVRCLTEFTTDKIMERLEEQESYTVNYSVMENQSERRKRAIISRLNGEKTRALLARLDVTEDYEEDHKRRSELANALEAADAASKSKTVFLANMSHEIRTPLNAIIGMTELADEFINDPDKLKQYIEKLKTSEKYLSTLLSDIIDVSKIDMGSIQIEHKRFAVSQLMDSIEAIACIAANDKGVTYVQKTESDEVSYCIGDMEHITRVILNLIQNSIKFTPREGLVKFSLISKKIGNQASLAFTVSDNGVGMKKDSLEHIFDPFWQENMGNTKEYSGSGVGLNISKRLISQMGGEITVESEEGKGSIFKVNLILPYSEDSLRSGVCDGGTAEDWRESFAGKRVLIVDDNLINLEIMAAVCEQNGLDVVMAQNGQEAFEIIMQEEDFYFDAVIMDIRMPKMDGYEVTDQIRKQDSDYCKNIIIFAASANAFPEDIEEAQKHGMNDFITKPVKPTDMCSKLYMEFLNRNRG